MVATCEDDFCIPSGEILIKPKNLVYSYFWERRDTDLPGGREFFGISLHPNLEDKVLFFDKYLESDRRKYKQNIPNSYYLPILDAEFVMSEEFYNFMQKDSYFRKIKGVFILEPNLVHLLNFNQIIQNEEVLTDIVNALKTKYSAELMTINRLYKEISQDTSIWYVNQQ